MNRFKFSSALYHHRTEFELTQEELAEELGISTRWYQNLESGRTLPGNELMLKLIAYFGIDGRELRENPQYLSPVVNRKLFPSNDVIYYYSLIRETEESEEHGSYSAYGIRVIKLTPDGEQFVRDVKDVSTDRSLMQRLIFKCNLVRLSPEHLNDVIEDAIGW